MSVRRQLTSPEPIEKDRVIGPIEKIEIATALQNLIIGTHRRNLAADKVEVAHPIEVGVVGDTGCAVAGAALGSAS